MKDFFKKEKYSFFITPALIWQIGFFFVSLLFVVQLAFFKQFFHEFTWNYFSQIFHITHFAVIFRSLQLAFVSAVLSLLCGYPIAYFLALYVNRRYKTILLFLITLPFLTNLLVQIYAWYFILEKNGILNKFLSFFFLNLDNWLTNSFAMYIVLFQIYLPFMIMPLYAILEKINAQLIEVSLDLGASIFQTFFRIVLPLSLQGIKTGFFLVYVMAFGEYVIPSLLGGQKKFFVGTLISEYFFIGRDWHSGAAFTCLSSFVFLLSIVLLNFLLTRFILYLQRV
ncbi:ABC transporter permease [Candidatus Dependentiae bacterium]|nr:ABC transporter permease [Candidatus Dependentiae bacterium]